MYDFAEVTYKVSDNI